MLVIKLHEGKHSRSQYRNEKKMTTHTFNKRKKRLRFGATSQKILLLLLSGLTLSIAGSPSRYFRLLQATKKEWGRINRQELYRAIRRLYESKLIAYKEHADGTTEIKLNYDGKKLALRYKLDELQIKKPKHWDQKWRIVLFDVPETKKKFRDALRIHFQRLGLIEFQKSVFVYPYPCRNEIEFVIDVFQAHPYVRFIEAIHIDNELHLKKKFDLI